MTVLEDSGQSGLNLRRSTDLITSILIGSSNSGWNPVSDCLYVLQHLALKNMEFQILFQFRDETLCIHESRGHCCLRCRLSALVCEKHMVSERRGHTRDGPLFVTL
ncbi:Hypothetical predicted protein [Xyrichtys novacula]|uniref:Uncharacterized protein n=2 Tax=Xyrichtys novacula TaxID=13765 RepID=A0AAV1EPI6_XYRNO|nr:Hypothetical predicted protein [Xyrichtys novacula]